LQHKNEKIIYFEEKSWTFVKGSLQTIDRDYGIINFILHRITDTHVCHHLFHTIPFYNAERATKAIKKRLGKFYQYDDTPIYSALWREMTNCRYVSGNEIKTFSKN
jgi:omega-6 fatty acid desaturase / acyl-lipid omega-6 desaturase (Delta-12 desaturase)